MIWVSVSIVAATSICLSAKIDPKRQVCISCHRRRKHDFALWISVFWKLYFPCFFFTANLPLFPAKPTVLPQLDSNVIINYKTGPNARQVHININKSWRIRQNVKTDECWSYYKNPLVYPKAKQYLCVCAGWSNILNAKHGHFSCRQTQLAAIWPISDCHDRTPEKCKYTNTQRQIQRHKYKYTNTNTQIQLVVIWPISDSRDRTHEKYNFRCLYEKYISVCLE